MKKAIVVGDSHTFFMSGDPRSKKFLDHVNSTNEDLFPIYWTSFFDNLEDDFIYCWKLAMGARKLNNEILEELLSQSLLIKKHLNNGAIAIFAFGVMEMGRYMEHTNDPDLAAQKYFNAVSSYCWQNNIKFRFVSPMFNGNSANMIDNFNDKLDSLCELNRVDKVIRYNNSKIPYKTYESADKHNHPSFEVLRNASKHISNSI